MHSSQGSNKEKQTARKAKMQTSANETRHSERKPKDIEGQCLTHKDASTSPIGRVVTEEHLKARISQKAYELYEKRQATTHLADWLESERLVKTELLAEGQWAGNV
jgi:hypothetical protein